MREFLNNASRGLKQGGIRAFFDRAAAYDDVINLGIGEPDLDTPNPIISAGYQAMLDGKTHYTANAGDFSVREEVAKYVEKYGIRANPQTNVIMTCGGMGAVVMSLLCTINPGDEILIQDPQWLNYYSQVKFAGGIAVPVPVYERNGFSLRASDIESRITEKSKIIMLNSPNNPTGAIIEENDLKDIAHLAEKYDLLVISDEVYCELIFSGMKHYSIGALPNMIERTIIVNSFSKSYSMTGWRIGFAVGPEDIINKMTVLQENLVACAPSFSQFAAKYALQTKCELAMMKKTYEKRRNLIVEGLNSISGISCSMPKGAFYAFPNIKQLGLNSQQIAEKILEEAHVVVIPGTAFGDQGEGYLRLAYSNSEEKIAEAIERIDRCVKGIIH